MPFNRNIWKMRTIGTFYLLHHRLPVTRAGLPHFLRVTCLHHREERVFTLWKWYLPIIIYFRDIPKEDGTVIWDCLKEKRMTCQGTLCSKDSGILYGAVRSPFGSEQGSSWGTLRNCENYTTKVRRGHSKASRLSIYRIIYHQKTKSQTNRRAEKKFPLKKK